MKPLLISACLILTLLYSSSANAEIRSREHVAIPSFQLRCAEEMILHIKDPADNARGHGLMAVEYYQSNDWMMALNHYHALLRISSKIKLKNKRYKLLLDVANTISPALSQLEKKTLFNDLMKDTSELFLGNKIGLALLAGNFGDYDQSFELVEEVTTLRDLMDQMEAGTEYFQYGGNIEGAIRNIIGAIIVDTSFATVDAKLKILKRFAEKERLSLNNWDYGKWVEKVIRQELEEGSVERAIEINQTYFDDYDKAAGLLMILDTLIGREELEFANQVYDQYQSNFKNDLIGGYLYTGFYYNRSYLRTVLYLGKLNVVKSLLSKEENPIFRSLSYIALADDNFRLKNSQLASNYLDSAEIEIANGMDKADQLKYTLKLAAICYKYDQLSRSNAYFQTIADDGLYKKKYYLEDGSEVAMLYASWGDYKKAMGWAMQANNDDYQCLRSTTLELCHQIALINGDTIEAMTFNDEAARQLMTISPVGGRDKYTVITALNYAAFGDYERAFEVIRGLTRSSTHGYNNIADFIKGLVDSYTHNEGRNVPEEFYVRFFEVIDIKYDYEERYEAYKFLIETYYQASYTTSEFDFEAELMSHLSTFEMKEVFISRSQFNQMDRLFSKDILLFYLYHHAGKTEELNELMKVVKRKCRKRKYKIHDLVDLLNIEEKFTSDMRHKTYLGQFMFYYAEWEAISKQRSVKE